jgi:hypothetical protein
MKPPSIIACRRFSVQLYFAQHIACEGCGALLHKKFGELFSII